MNETPLEVCIPNLVEYALLADVFSSASRERPSEMDDSFKLAKDQALFAIIRPPVHTQCHHIQHTMSSELMYHKRVTASLLTRYAKYNHENYAFGYARILSLNYSTLAVL